MKNGTQPFSPQTAPKRGHKVYTTKYSKFYQEWVALYKSGRSIRSIAMEYSCRKNDIKRCLKKGAVAIEYRIGLRRVVVQTAEDAYNKYVIKRDGCWSWAGPVNSKGYGVFRASGKSWLAHRYSYSASRGQTGKLFVCHSCDNPICTNPDHLFLGTAQDNMVDCFIKGRNPTAKLKISEVTEIRSLIDSGEDNRQIAEKYGVSDRAIEKIKYKQTWKYIK